MSNPVSFEDLSLADGELFHDYKGVAYTMPEPLAPLADTHGHLTSFRELDPAVTLVRAALAGVRLLVVPIDPIDDVPRRWGSVSELLSWLDEQVERDRAGVAACAEHGFVPPAFEGYDAPDLLDSVRIVAGAHPYGAEKFDDDVMARLRELLASPRCVGVGEFGLDYGPSSTVPYPVQEEVFRAHLRLAGELGLPVQLHIRDAANDVRCGAHRDAARILEEEGVPEAGCDLHCFTSGIRVLESFTRLDCRIAFGGAVTFTRSDDIREAATFCAERYLLTETDSPYMAPVPLRGAECEPAMVGFTAATVADVREKGGRGSRQETYDALWRNACALFAR